MKLNRTPHKILSSFLLGLYLLFGGLAIFSRNVDPIGLTPVLLFFKSYRGDAWEGEFRHIPNSLLREGKREEVLIQELSYGPNFRKKLDFWIDSLHVKSVFREDSKLYVSLVTGKISPFAPSAENISNLRENLIYEKVETLYHGLQINFKKREIFLYINGISIDAIWPEERDGR